MVTHWLGTPEGGYLGSTYGSNIKALLQRPQVDSGADEFIQKMKIDIPILNALPGDAINIFGVHSFPDRLDIVLEVYGNEFNISDLAD